MATWNDLVRRIWGECTDKEAEVLLWHCTCFPFGSVLHVARQLREKRKQSGGDFDKAWRSADKEIEEAMKGTDASAAETD